MVPSAVDRAVRSARRRLVTQRVLDRATRAITIALVLGLGWVVVEPLLLAAPPGGSRWVVVGSLLGAGLGVAVVRAVRSGPSPLVAALELDSRFGLRERVTTAATLPADLRETAAGQAVLADAEAHVASIQVREKFPVRWPRRVEGIPLLAGLIALVAFVYHPITDSAAWSAKVATPATVGMPKDSAKAPTSKEWQPRNAPERPNQSPKVKALVAELDRLEQQAQQSPSEAVKEKLTELTSAEDRAKALERESAAALARMEQKLRELDDLTTAGDFGTGPARDLNDALATGELQKAERAVEELAKKARDNSLSPQEAGELAKQLDRMRNELQRLAKNTSEREKAQKLIDQARKEGRDPEALQRELDRLDREAEQMKELKDLADSLGSARDALTENNKDAATQSLDRLAEQIRRLQDEVKDLEDLRDQLERLEGIKALAERPGEQQGLHPGGRQANQATRSGTGEPGHADNVSGNNPATGERPDKPDAKTARGPDERQHTPFDPTGRKTNGRSLPGPAFSRMSPAELGPAITRAAQEAPDAVANQPVSRDDKEAVKEFFRTPPK